MPELPKVIQNLEAPYCSATIGNGTAVIPNPIRLMNTTSHNTHNFAMSLIVPRRRLAHKRAALCAYAAGAGGVRHETSARWTG